MRLRLHKLVIAVVLGFSAAGSANAAAIAENGPGHWAWVVEFQPGPKSSPPSHRRVWIADRPDQAVGDATGHTAGSWQWVTEVSVGPRAGAPVHRRVWLPAN